MYVSMCMCVHMHVCVCVCGGGGGGGGGVGGCHNMCKVLYRKAPDYSMVLFWFLNQLPGNFIWLM